MPKQKQKNYEELFDRIKIAHSSGFYFEKVWIAYSIIEDRLVSLLRKSGGINYNKGESKKDQKFREQIKMLGPKIFVINKRKKNNPLLRFVLYGDYLKEVQKWSKKRNRFMHALAEEAKPIKRLEKEIYIMSTEGETIARELCSRARRLKKRVKKK